MMKGNDDNNNRDLIKSLFLELIDCWDFRGRCQWCSQPASLIERHWENCPRGQFLKDNLRVVNLEEKGHYVNNGKKVFDLYQKVKGFLYVDDEEN